MSGSKDFIPPTYLWGVFRRIAPFGSIFEKKKAFNRNFSSVTVLIDTNVFMAARWKRGGFGFRILEKAASGELPLVWCSELKEEVFRILNRTRSSEEFLELAQRCFPRELEVESGPRRNFGAGRVDDILIGCCLSNPVDVLISSDKRMSSTARRIGVSTYNPAEFWERFPLEGHAQHSGAASSVMKKRMGIWEQFKAHLRSWGKEKEIR